jgi:hypothetical protein
MKTAGSGSTYGSGSISQRHGSANIRIHTKMSWIRNTDLYMRLVNLPPAVFNTNGSGTAWIPIKLKGRIQIRIKVISWIRICIHLQMTSKNVWNISLFEHLFKVLSFYLEARMRIRTRINWHPKTKH